jgi:histidinol-phosphatase (PHP family)
MGLHTDYHWHTPLCQHAAGPMEAYVERAIELKLQQVGFSCHNPLPAGLGANVRMREAELEYYVRRVQELQLQYRGRIELLLGLEMDFVPHILDFLVDQIGRYPWDYVIGSVHYLDPACQHGAWSRNLPFDATEQYRRYFNLIRQMVRSGLCDIVGHLDVPKRSGRHLPGTAEEDLERTLQEIKRTNVAVEINTSGHRHTDLSEPGPYPAWPVVKRALEIGIPLVVNSDAHAPEHVGLEFAATEQKLRQLGCRQLARFHQRQRLLVDFDSAAGPFKSVRHETMM